MPGFPRLASHDYRQPGAYFVTVVTWRRLPLFGTRSNGRVELSPEGAIVTLAWFAIPHHFPSVTLDQFVVMPDHFHGVLCLHEFRSPLSQIVNLFKGDATRAIRALPGRSGLRVWQRGFHDRVVRSDPEWRRIRRYIDQNPLQED
jgi:REP-associated tyrosine transposase